MNAFDELLIERACERLVAESAVFNDQREWAALAALYTADGVVVRRSLTQKNIRAAVNLS